MSDQPTRPLGPTAAAVLDVLLAHEGARLSIREIAKAIRPRLTTTARTTSLMTHVSRVLKDLEEDGRIRRESVRLGPGGGTVYRVLDAPGQKVAAVLYRAAP